MPKIAGEMIFFVRSEFLTKIELTKNILNSNLNKFILTYKNIVQFIYYQLIMI